MRTSEPALARGWTGRREGQILSTELLPVPSPVPPELAIIVPIYK